MTENDISYTVIGCSMEIHRHLGPGLLESVYENTLAFELRTAGLEVKQQPSLPVVYKDVRLDSGYRLDLLVNNKVIVEIKSVEVLAPLHHAQLLTYLRLSGHKLGLLINFNTVVLKTGVTRIVNNLQ
ncbi:MAG: GxxExxY protein [Bacteroidia bacterium]|nr:GxxExxY protein [Bacteroidia bacterium]